MKRRLLLRATFRLLAASMQAGSMLMLATSFGSRDFGIFAAAYALAFVALGVLSGGAQYRALRLARDADADERNILIRRSTLLFAAILSLVPASLFFGEIGVLLALACISALADQYANILSNLYAAVDSHGVSGAILVLVRAPGLIGLSMGIYIFQGFGAEGFGLGILAALIVLLAWGLIRSRKKLRGQRFVARVSGYAAIALTSALVQLEPLIVTIFASVEIAGSYALAMRSAAPFAIAVGAIVSVVTPILARNEVGLDGILMRQLRFSILGIAFVIAALSAPAGFAVGLIVGSQYADIELYVTGAIIGVALSAVSQTYVSRLLASGWAGRSALLFGIGGTVAITVTAILCSLADANFLWAGPILTQAVFLAVAVRLSAVRDK